MDCRELLLSQSTSRALLEDYHLVSIDDLSPSSPLTFRAVRRHKFDERLNQFGWWPNTEVHSWLIELGKEVMELPEDLEKLIKPVSEA